jgi:hypothetical protein
MEGEGKIMVTLRWGKKKMLWVQCFLFLILKLSTLQLEHALLVQLSQKPGLPPHASKFYYLIGD